MSRIKNDDRIFYMACQSCRKKVIEEGPNSYRCENCNKSFESYDPTYMMTARISDFTDSVFVSFSREHGDKLMGMTAAEFKHMRETQSPEEVEAHLESLTFKPMNIMVKGRYEMFNNEYKVKFFAMKVFPRNVPAENKALLHRLDLYSQM